MLGLGSWGYDGVRLRPRMNLLSEETAGQLVRLAGHAGRSRREETLSSL